MRPLAATGFLLLWAGTALAAYVVELDGGDRMTVDSYWEEGDRTHLMRGGIALSVPRSRIRSLKETAEAPEAGVRTPSPVHTSPGPRAASAETPQSREELEARQRRIDHHLIRVQQERFEAKARGDSPKTLRRLEREFKRTQQRRIEGMRQLADAPAS
jgi:hypothetical protein